MKKIMLGIVATLLIAGAAVYANGNTAKKACCVKGATCCTQGGPCCSK